MKYLQPLMVLAIRKAAFTLNVLQLREVQRLKIILLAPISLELRYMPAGEALLFLNVGTLKTSILP
jgi:hypothetical protein